MSAQLPIVSSSLPIAVDAMGGDHGPAVVVEGAVLAARELGISCRIVGNELEIKPILARLGFSSDSRISTLHASEVVDMHDSPSAVIRSKPDSSIRRSFDLVRLKEASAVVSPGNTGAVMATGLFVAGTLPGIARPAIASLVPKVGDAPPTVLLDSGANIDCTAIQLVQFALMGSYYASTALGIENPRVALLSNGTEATKGTDIIRAAAQLMNEMKDLNFTGYVEGRDIGRNVVDVIVCDGFVGNTVLKTIEGSVELVLDSIRQHVETSSRGRLGMWLARPSLRFLFQEKLDPSSYGGAPLLGLTEVAVICHGSSESRAIQNAIRMAKRFVDGALVAKITGALNTLDAKLPGVFENGILSRVGQRFDKKRHNSGAGTTPPAAASNTPIDQQQKLASSDE